ncbi:sugar ABC transporter permease [Clostridium estertheticum]|uniref:carbohydrate ABC transporter permease n=1 Tax=Clostridium estertheticum TaxID=238834 RepID=UPI001CD1082C|nr:sugar ABC transporter permease [Clostridium estertheticum]MBZ9685773.1 sugar ABC transporter permease [Clostridium estertheticum]
MGNRVILENRTIKSKTLKSKNFLSKKNISLLAFVAPALILYIIFLVIPLISGFWYSLTNWNGLARSYNFVGISNFVEAFKEDKDFIASIIFTFKFAVIIVIFQNIFALGLALMIDSKKKSTGFFRTILFMPNMISMVIASFVWVFIFSKVFTQIAAVTPFKFLDQSWFGDAKLAFFAIVVVTLWAGVGYMMLIYLAALQGVPQELKEAAVIDGANVVQIFFKVILPMIMHSITICTFLTLAGAFKAFDIVFALTAGGPVRATEVMGLNIYQEAFMGNMRFGYASAKSIILFLIILIVTLVQLGVLKKREVEA